MYADLIWTPFRSELLLSENWMLPTFSKRTFESWRASYDASSLSGENMNTSIRSGAGMVLEVRNYISCKVSIC